MKLVKTARPLDRIISEPFGLFAKRPPAGFPHWALFLELEGTLVEVANGSPGRVLPADLPVDLQAASAVLGGALALFSGRAVADVEQLISPASVPIAGEYGASVRLPNGKLEGMDCPFPLDWLDVIRRTLAGSRGIFIERKYSGLAVHFRGAPNEGARVRDLVNGLVGHDCDMFEVVTTRTSVQIRPKFTTKGRAVLRLMNSPPFVGRVPVYVGSDVRDQDVMRAVRALGGFGIKFDESFWGQPAHVRRWLNAIGGLGAQTES